MRKKICSMMALLCLLLSSCNNELVEPQVSTPEENLLAIEQSYEILSFENEESFLDAVEKARNEEIPDALLTRSVDGGKFASLFDEYDQAMEEADYFYQRDGGYEEFKQKFPNLYYPEKDDDYSAYLPISDEAIAKLINPQGKVIINGVERDMRDVFSYEKLKELGLAIPDETETVSSRAVTNNSVIDPTFPYNTILTTSKRKINSKRKMWVTIRGIERESKHHPYLKEKEARIDFCWRKKGKLGWYNGKLYGYPTIVDLKKNRYTLDRKYEYSPMKFPVMREFSIEVKNFPDNSPLDVYVRFESKEKNHDFTAVYPANLKQILERNNGDGFWETLDKNFRKVFKIYGEKYGTKYLDDLWNNTIND